MREMPDGDELDRRFAAQMVASHRTLLGEWSARGGERLARLEGVLAEKRDAGADVVLAGVLSLVHEQAATIKATPSDLERVLEDEGLRRGVEVHYGLVGALQKLDAVEMMLGLRDSDR